MGTVPDMVASTALRSPDSMCVSHVESGRMLTFADVHDRANRLVAAFRTHGIDRGDRVALLARNEIEFVELVVACQRAGAILTPLNHRLSGGELRWLVDDARPAVLVVGAGVIPPAVDTPVWWLGDQDGPGARYEALLTDHAPRRERATISAEEICTLLYTSGTTGTPRGVCISNRAIFARACSYVAELMITAHDVFLQPMPLFHISAHVSLAFTYRGAANVIARDFDPDAVVASIGRHGVTQMLLVPTAMKALCDVEPSRDQTSTLRCLSYGGSTISAELVARTSAILGCDLVQFYGMTELGAATVLRADDHTRPELLTAAGVEDLCTEVVVLDLADGAPAPVGVHGEIAARGPSAMSGYWGADPVGNGWIRTGDLGYRDAEGYLFVVDRLKDIIVSGGENVASRQVEEVVATHPDVEEVAVIGRPDPHWGEVVHAVVRPRPGTTVDLASVQAHCAGRLARYKVPRSLSVVEDMPRTAAGKVPKAELRRRYG